MISTRNEESLNSSEDSSMDFDTVCLPGCSNREYKSALIHLLILSGFTFTSATLLLSSIQFMLGAKGSDDIAMKNALFGIAGAIGVGLLTACGFFAGTQEKTFKDEELQINKTNNPHFKQV